MIAIPLSSGSNGNAIYVEALGTRLIVDAGISGSRAEERLARHGRDIRHAEAVLISHDHRDHIGSAGVFQRKFGLPIYLTRPTLAAVEGVGGLGKVTDVRHFTAGSTFRVGALSIETVRTPHDAADGVGFVIQADGKRLGILTDLGHPFADLKTVLETLDAVIFESNYDEQMLLDGPYPAFLKARIQGPHGHISNHESAELIERHAGSRLQWLCLAHLSGDNNTPELALRTHREVHDGRLPIHVASRYDVGPVLRVE